MKSQKNTWLLDKIFSFAKTQPEKLALKFLESDYQSFQAMTYQELAGAVKAKSAAIQAYLAQLGKANGTQRPMLLIFDSGLEYVVTFLAVLNLGHIAVTAYPPTKSRHLQRLQNIINDSEAELILTTEKIKTYCQDNKFVFQQASPLVSCDELATLASESHQVATVQMDDIAFLQYTSGSTGKPKGVVVTHKNISENLELLAWHMNVADGSSNKSVSWLPIFHDMGLIEGTLLPLNTGATCVLMAPLTFLKNPLFWLQTMSDEQATYTAAPNFAYDLVSNLLASKQAPCQFDFHRAHCFIVGAEPVRAQTIERFETLLSPYQFRQGTIKPGYGMAETTLVVSLQSQSDNTHIIAVDKKQLQHGKVIPCDDHSQAVKLVRCGKISAHYQAKIVDPETLQQVPEGTIGELWLQGASIAKGYYKNSEQTAASFQAYTSDTHEGPFLRTGDLAFFDDEGYLVICGRCKDVIIINGRNIYPQDIESVTYDAHPDTIENAAAAFSVPGPQSEQCVLVAEAKKNLEASQYQDILTKISKSVSEHFDIVIADILLISPRSLLKTSSGKIQRSACKAAYLNDEFKTLASLKSAVENEPASAATMNVSAVTAWLQEWVAINANMSVDDISSERAFVDFNLSSIQMVSMIRDLETQFHCRLDAFLAWEYPTIASLAERLSCEDEHDTVADDFTYEPIAVVGIDCKLPGPQEKNIISKEVFWDFLLSPNDNLRAVPVDRWDMREFFDPDPEAPGKMYASAGGFMTDIKKFNAKFFNLSPRETEYLDPQQRLALMVTWNAIEDAGIVPKTLVGTKTGIYFGISTHDYDTLIQKNVPLQELNTYQATGTSFSTAAGRLAYFLGTQGPCMAIDTACSSSLVSLHEACRALQAGDCSTAIAGGVNMILSPESSIIFCKSKMLSPTNKCHTFDANADGYVRGEGCGVVVLKRLQDALKDGNKIYAVIRGSAVNQDGASNGLTAPNLSAQTEVMQQALMFAKVQAHEIEHVEAHGTGTPLGDPIEWEGIRRVYGKGRQSNLHITSLKTRVGHLESAAGIFGFIKTVLAVEKGIIPAHLNLNTFNPKINQQDDMQVPNEALSWRTENRLAAVSSFGFSGTNAHIVLSNLAGASEQQSTQSKYCHDLLVLSAHKSENLEDYQARYAECVDHQPDLDFQLLCSQSQHWRTHFPERAYLLADNDQQTRAAILNQQWQTLANSPAQGLAWFFTGQGCLSNNMAKAIYEGSEFMATIIDQACELTTASLSYDLRNVLLDTPPEIDINDTLYAQPALFVYEYTLAKWFMHLGIQPSIMLGHSLGEYVAACLSGVMTLPDALTLVCQRATLMSALPSSGAMLAIAADAATVAELIALWPGLVISVKNNAQQTVVSGEQDLIDACLAHCQKQNLKASLLKTSHAFHSPLMQPMLDEFLRFANEITYAEPQIPVVLNVTGELAQAGDINANYWCDHIVQAVEFEKSINVLDEQHITLCQEIGPKPIAMMHAQATYSCITIASVVDASAPWRDLVNAVGQLYLHGHDVAWERWSTCPKGSMQPLPRYPFLGREYWLPINTFDKQVSQHWKTNLFCMRWKVSPQLVSKTTTLGKHVCVLTTAERDADLFAVLGSEVQTIFLDEHKVSQWQQSIHACNDCDVIVYVCGKDDDLQRTLNRFRTVSHVVLQDFELTPFVVLNEDSTNAGQALLAALKSIKQEYPAWPITYFEGAVWDDANYQWFTHVHADAPEWAFRYKDGDYSCQYLEPYAAESLHEQRQVNPQQAYLITGACGDLGQLIVESLVEQGVKRIIALGRRAVSQPWSDAVQQQIELGLRADYYSCDVSDYNALQALLNMLDLEDLAVIHAAGALDDKPWMMSADEDVANIVSGKASGALNFHRLSSDHNITEFICISSIASTLGNHGQAIYAAANAYVDALFAFRQNQGLPAVSMLLGPVQGKGFFKAHEEQLRDHLAMLDIEPLQPLSIKHLFKLALPQTNILMADFGTTPQVSTDTWVNQILFPDSRNAEKQVEKSDPVAIVLGVASDVLGVDLSELNPTDDWFEYGMDSIMATQMVNAINSKFKGNVVSVQAIFSHSCASKLVENIEIPDSLHSDVKPRVDSKAQLNSQTMPLSLQQQEVWNYLRAGVDDLAYQMPMILKIEGALDTDKLVAAIKNIGNAHDIFKLSFHESLQQVNQHINDDVQFNIDVVQTYNENDVAAFIEAKFELSIAPLMRTRIYKQSDNVFYWSIVFHHLIADGYTFSRFVEDVLADYFSQDKEACNKHYLELVAWQWDTIYPQLDDALLQFWKEKLENVALGVPTNKLVSTPLPIAAEVIHRHIKTSDIDTVLSRLQTEKITLSNFLLAHLFNTLIGSFDSPRYGVVVFFSGRESGEFARVYGDTSNDVVFVSENEADIFKHASDLQRQAHELIDKQYMRMPILQQHDMELPRISYDFQSIDFNPDVDGLTVSLEKASNVQTHLWGDDPRYLSFKVLQKSDGTLILSLKYRRDKIATELAEKLLDSWLQAIHSDVPEVNKHKPISVLQENLWALMQSHPDGLPYHVPIIKQCPADIDCKRLETAINDAIHNHPGLRTYFDAIDDKLSMQFADQVAFSLQVLQVNNLTESFAELLQQPIDIHQAPLMNVTLMQSPDAIVLFMKMHHLLVDGISAEMFIKEVEDRYLEKITSDALINDHDYYALYKNSVDHYDDNLRNFQSYFKGFHDVVHSCERYRNSQTAPCLLGNFLHKKLPSEIAQFLRDFCAQHHISRYTFYLTIFCKVLAAFFEEKHVYTSIVKSNRGQIQHKNIIGYFADSIPLYTQVDHDDFHVLANELQSKVLALVEDFQSPLRFDDVSKLDYIVPPYIFNHYETTGDGALFQSADYLFEEVLHAQQQLPYWNYQSPEVINCITRSNDSYDLVGIIFHADSITQDQARDFLEAFEQEIWSLYKEG